MNSCRFSWKNADYRIFSDDISLVKNEIKKQRRIIEKYIIEHPEFKTALKPVNIYPDAPEIIIRMDNASKLTGTGPMASVAGVIAQFAAEKAVKSGIRETIVENGGDIFLISEREVITGLYAGNNKISGNFALKIPPDFMPAAVCSSSSFMGHSLSYGKCDLATVISKDGALADSAATKACNMVKSTADIEYTLNEIIKISGITGVIIVINNNIGFIGDLPEIIKNTDKELKNKISRHQSIKI